LQEDLIELSTPVLSLWDGVLSIPLIGTLDSRPAQDAMEKALTRMMEDKAKVLVVAITGVPTVDTFIHTGIGNVEARVYPRGKAALIPHAGILGGGIFRPHKVSKVPWPEGGMLSVFSDGGSGRWDLEEVPGAQKRHVTTLANLFMREYSRTDEDASLVVAKELIQ
jgi:hypothetical protein